MKYLIFLFLTISLFAVDDSLFEYDHPSMTKDSSYDSTGDSYRIYSLYMGVPEIGVGCREFQNETIATDWCVSLGSIIYVSRLSLDYSALKYFKENAPFYLNRSVVR